MKVKRFFAPDMRQAMGRVRDEIGPDAVIVSNRRVAGGVEVVAAHEQEYEAAQVEFKRERARKRRQDEQIRLLTGHKQPADNPALDAEMEKAKARIASAQRETEVPSAVTGTRNQQIEREDDLESILASLKSRQVERAQAAHQGFVRSQERPDPAVSPAGGAEQGALLAMQQEIHQLRAMLEKQVQAQAEMNEPHSLLLHKLGALGIGQRLARHLVAAVEPGLTPEKTWQTLLTRLAESIPVVGEEFTERGGMIAFVGPTGVGKTTTIGKLAARYVLKYGSSSLALVTTDTYRIAAHEQLKTFGRILDVPVRVVDGANSLEQVLQSLRNKKLVLIDTAGLSAGDQHSRQQFDMLDGVSLRMKKLLVVSCSSQRQVIEKGYEAYKRLGLNGCVLSKMDESGSLGDALSFVVERNLAVAYAAHGQRIPDDIGVGNKRELVSRAVLTAQESSESGDGMPDELSKIRPLFNAG
ncbi:MAG: flagellar biosynthesis protein FlhF [Pontibacterium sp.]